jgi:hypothetical protein
MIAGRRCCFGLGRLRGRHIPRGAARGKITPELGQPSSATFDLAGQSLCIDDLWVRCIALDDGTTRVAFVCLTLLQFGRR